MTTHVTHKTTMDSMMARTRDRVVRLLDITRDDYAELHYEMSVAYLYLRGYNNAIVRRFMVSKSFHRWWNQQLMHREIVWLNNFAATANVERYIGYMITLPFFPNDRLLAQIFNEAMVIFYHNPEMENLNYW